MRKDSRWWRAAGCRLSLFGLLGMLPVVATSQAVGAAATAGPASAAPDAARIRTVRLDSGWLRGVSGRDPSISVFRGIPYAAAPVGALRWRAPQPPTPWQGIRPADRFGSICPQDGPQQGMSEDCLYANVWTGARDASERRPVFVWIYGGAFLAGAGSDPQFDGEALARKGVVVVTFNYRLGALGFLATPELSRESGHAASGNFGLLDDIALLQWVRRNIAAFGGDPARVTIGGQSAGAGSVGFLAMSPLARGLFRRAIQESHARYAHDTELRYLAVSWRSLPSAEASGLKFAAERGARSLPQLRALPWQRLIVAANATDHSVETGSDAKPPLFRPVIDGYVLPYDYSETYARHAQNDVAVIAGNNLDESGAVPESTFAARRAAHSAAHSAAPAAGLPRINLTVEALQSAARRKFGPMAAEFLRLYPADSDDQAAQQNDASVRDNSRISTYLWAVDFTAGTNRPVYTYFWTHRPPGDPAGAHHGSEIDYVFDNLALKNQPWTDADRRIAGIMSSYWANFVATGDPNGPGLPLWPPFDARSPTVMELGDRFGPMPIASPARLDFWKRFFATQPGW